MPHSRSLSMNDPQNDAIGQRLAPAVHETCLTSMFFAVRQPRKRLAIVHRAGALLTEHAALLPFAMLTQRSCRKVLPSNAWTDEHVILRRVKLNIGTLGTGAKQDEPLLVPVLFLKEHWTGQVCRMPLLNVHWAHFQLYCWSSAQFQRVFTLFTSIDRTSSS